MYSPASIVFAIACIQAHMVTAIAMPKAQWSTNGLHVDCPLDPKIDVASHEDAEGAAVVGSYSCKGSPGTCSLTAQSSYSVGVTVEVGASLNFDAIAGSAGISASVAITTETSTTQGAEQSCPKGPWTCALSIKPAMIRVRGTQTVYDDNCKKQDPQDYDVLFPRYFDDHLQGANVEVCVCKNKKHWADKKAPKLACPQDCA